MTAEEIKLECLKLAERRGGSPADAVETARAWSDFVLGRRDAAIVAAARNLAAAVSGAP